MIYHYTSLQNLAVILNSRKIRFNRLDKVDDLSESIHLPGQFKTYYFVSCWTKSNEENIALWNMYTLMKGVRISLAQEPFNLHFIRKEDFPQGFIKKEYQSLFRKEEYFINNPTTEYMFLNAQYEQEFKLYDIHYLDNPGEFIKSAIRKEQTENGELKFSINNNFPAMVKSKEWSFQKESRFIIPVIPCGRIDEASKKLITEPDMVEKIPFLRDFFDIELKEECIDNIKVTLAPCSTAADRIIVESLLQKFTKNGCVSDSSLKGTIACK